MREPKPSLLPTGRHRRNVLIAAAVIAVIVAAAIVYFLSSALAKPSALSATAIQASTPVVVKEVQSESTSDVNTPENAKALITGYYDAIAARDSSKLRSLGCTEAANAMERGWLDDVGLVVDASKTANPDRDGFPSAVGLYAGCTVYRIADFYNMPSNEAVKSDVTGTSSVQGWIYFNPMTSSWVLVDPLMPTAVAKPQAENMEKTSRDGLAKATLSSAGAYSNPWWCYAKIKVSVENQNADSASDVVISANNSFDRGITLTVPNELQGSVGHAGATSSTASNSNSNSSGATATTAAKKEGECVIYRGTISNFGIDRIGAKAQDMDGNICPVVISYGDENIAPLFPIGASTLEDELTKYSSDQISSYGANTSTGEQGEQDGGQ